MGIVTNQCSYIGAQRKTASLPSIIRPMGATHPALPNLEIDPMPDLTIALLGTPLIQYNNKLLKFDVRKTVALIAYLAVTGAEGSPYQSREALATLLWPESNPANARSVLRRNLSVLNRRIEGDWLAVERNRIGLNPNEDIWIDVIQYRLLQDRWQSHRHQDEKLCSECYADLTQAVDLMRGPFLDGFSLRNSDQFDEWQAFVAQQLQVEQARMLESLVRHLRAEQDFDRALHYAQRLLVLDPLYEPANTYLMQFYACTGQQAASLQQYQHYTQLLDIEVGIPPSEELTAFYRQILDGEAQAGEKHLRIAGQLESVPDGSTLVPSESRSETRPVQDRGEAPTIHTLYGRQFETTRLTNWLVHEQRQVVALLGIGGVGKTTLAANVSMKIADRFDFVIWRSLLNAPPLEEVLQDWLDILSGHTSIDSLGSLDKQLRRLFEYLRKRRCLLVLDNMESVLSANRTTEKNGDGTEGYLQLIQRMGTSIHRSALLITSRDRPYGVGRLAERTPAVQTMQLDGLNPDASEALMAARGFSARHTAVRNLANHYSGNPLALELVARTIHELFDSDIDAFIDDEIPVFGDIRDVLDQQFSRLSEVEKQLMLWLAIEREPITDEALNANLVRTLSRRELLEALRTLQRRSLLVKSDAGFSLQSVVMECTTDLLVERIVQEVEAGSIDLLHRYALLKANAKEYVRQAQERLILGPIGRRLLSRFGRAGLEARLEQLLAEVRIEQRSPLDYAGGNLLNLAIQCGLAVSQLDFSDRPIVQAFLRDAQLFGVNFRNSKFVSTRFRDTFGINYAVAISQDNQWLATGTSDFSVRIWKIATQETYAVLGGHTQAVWDVFFSQDGRWLASCSYDKTVRIWDVQLGRELYCLDGHIDGVRALALAPDGRTLASASYDGQIRLWDLGTQGCRTVFESDSELQSVAFTPDGRYLVAGGSDRRLLFWDLESQSLTASLAGHSDQINSVALSMDGTTVASGSNDYTIRLWHVATRQPLATLSGHTGWVTEIAFYANGKMLASAGADQTVRLWDVASGRCLQVLHGHTGSVLSLAVSQDSRLIASTSEDQTVRLWDAMHGQTLFTLRGYNGAIGSLAYRQNGHELITAGADGTIYVWDTQTDQVVRGMTGHKSLIRSLALSPDSQLLVSTDEARSVFVWDLRDWEFVRRLQGHMDTIRAVQFSLDGKWVFGGGDDHTIYCWDVLSGRHQMASRY